MTAKTISAPILLNETGKDFLAPLRKNANTLGVVGSLLANQSTKKEWETALENISWAEIDPVTIRSIVLETYKNPCGYFILGKILYLNVLHFEDFIKMSETWENYDFYLTYAVMCKCHEIAKHCNKVLLGRTIADRIANSGYPSWRAVRSSYD